MGHRNGADSIKLPEKESSEKKDGEFLEILRTVFDNNTLGISVLDGEGVCLEVNRGVKRLTGFDSSDMKGRRVAGGIFSNEEENIIKNAIENRVDVENMEVCILRKGGGEKNLIVNMAPRYGEDGELKGYIQFLIDNTEKKHLQNLLMRSQKMEIVGEMAGGIAHDFNNLLEGVLGYTTFMIDLVGENHELRSYLDIVRSSAKKASELTERLLTFSGDRGTEEKLVNCNVLIKEVVKLLERTIDRKISIELSLEEEINAVKGSSGQLEQAFLNVCLNARHAMPDGGKLMISSENVEIGGTQPRIDLNMKRGKYVKVSIADTGIGMDRETRARIFEPFFTTKERSEGTGLGLSMVYGIINNHGGFINVYSEVGEGSVFNIYLPSASKQAPVPKKAPGKGEIPEGNGECILIIDDEPMVRELARDMLEKLNYRPLVAGGAGEGIEIFKDKMDEIAVVILDVIMPHASGKEVLKNIREIKEDTRVIISSGYNESFIGEEILQDVKIKFIQKPYSMEKLAVEVKRVVDQSS
jgi:two-component system cell cycle sensor histidine kinase/response regulator CckA